MNFLRLEKYVNPEDFCLEIVERKGLGHPDTLADGLADSVSLAYSRYCINEFGMVLHHNVDKLYIGGGWFKRDYGICEMIRPVKVSINGRMSSCFSDIKIPLKKIQKQAVIEYLSWTLPNLLSDHIAIETNATQHTLRKNWFTPRSKKDLPDAIHPMANDTSVMISHWPFTMCEQLAYEIEASLWNFGVGHPKPRYDFIGQDVKVMVYRQSNIIDVTVCVPILSTKVGSHAEYLDKVRDIESILSKLASDISKGSGYYSKLRVNPGSNGYNLYMLGTGSCVECGEEGVVGRGNNASGVISIFRSHSMESPFGKNPVYHTGRVMGYLSRRLAKKIFEKFHTRCTVIVLTKNGQSLIPPHMLTVQSDSDLDRDQIEQLIKREFIEADYLSEILSERMVL